MNILFLTYFLHFLQVVVNINAAGDGVHFRRAGPRDKVFISICYLIIILPTFVSLPTYELQVYAPAQGAITHEIYVQLTCKTSILSRTVICFIPTHKHVHISDDLLLCRLL